MLSLWGDASSGNQFLSNSVVHFAESKEFCSLFPIRSAVDNLSVRKGMFSCNMKLNSTYLAVKGNTNVTIPIEGKFGVCFGEACNGGKVRILNYERSLVHASLVKPSNTLNEYLCKCQRFTVRIRWMKEENTFKKLEGISRKITVHVYCSTGSIVLTSKRFVALAVAQYKRTDTNIAFPNIVKSMKKSSFHFFKWMWCLLETQGQTEV